jgi:hypothetical protein
VWLVHTAALVQSRKASASLRIVTQVQTVRVLDRNARHQTKVANFGKNNLYEIKAIQHMNFPQIYPACACGDVCKKYKD